VLTPARLRTPILMLTLALGAYSYGCNGDKREFGSTGVSSGTAGASAGSVAITSGGVQTGGGSGDSTVGGTAETAGAAGADESAGAVGADAVGGSGGGTVFTQPPMDGLALWLVADDGPELYGNTITKWRDRSGNGLVLQQTVTSKQPTLKDNALGGRRVVYFDGDDDGLDVPSGFDFSKGLSIFAMMRMDTVPTDRCAEILDLTGDGFVYFMAFTSFRYEADNHANAVNGPALAAGVPHFVSVIHSPASANEPAHATLRQDGSVYQDGASSFPLPKGIHVKNGLGGDIDVWCHQFHGYIAELLVYNRAVSYAEEMAINARMQKEWQCCGQGPTP
jgi:hypothetical protein